MALFERLFGGGDCIRVSYGNITDGVVQIKSGALVGMEDLIKKINRNRKHALIELTVMGNTQQIGVAVDIASKS